ncbi:Alpha/Beta hydrolase protein [Aspergillus californicus]
MSPSSPRSSPDFLFSNAGLIPTGVVEHHCQPPYGQIQATAVLDMTWNGQEMRRATSYYLSDTINLSTISQKTAYTSTSSDRGYENKKLPVGVWIHGGGFSHSGGGDQRYNPSVIPLGLPALQRRRGRGPHNGLRDHRIALQWVQKNIAFFAGDPRKVTIWASLQVLHLSASSGRSDNLFRAAILQSGNPIYYGSENGHSSCSLA